jgi:hypothetical protein
VRGKVRLFHEFRKFGFIIGADARAYFVSPRCIRPDEFSRRYLIVGEPVNFTPMDVLATGRLWAKNILPDRLIKTAETPQDHREEFQIVAFFSGDETGFAKRSGHNSIWFRFRTEDIISELPADFEITVGTRLWAGLKRDPSYPTTKFQLHSIEVCREHPQSLSPLHRTHSTTA